MHTNPVLTIGILGLVLALSPTAYAGGASPAFDKPVRVVRKPLPKDPLNPQTKPELSCFYYPAMMIKQVDMGEIGAERLSVTPIEAGAKTPACVREQTQEEIVLGHTENWEGYFLGAKGGYLVLTGADGSNGAEAFGVFGPNGDKLLEDDIKRLSMIKLIAPENGGNSRPLQGKLLRLRYTRVVVAECSIFENAATCWPKIQKATGITDALPAACIRTYAREQKRQPADQRQQFVSDPTVVSYPAEVILDGKGIASPLKPAGKLAGCRPGD